MTQARRFARILAACLADGDVGNPPTELLHTIVRGELPRLIGLAERNRVIGYLDRQLRSVPVDVPPALAAAVTDRVRFQLGRHMRTLADLAALANALDQKGLPWLVVKGPVLSERAHAAPELRSYQDVDVVVPAASFRAVVETLESVGCDVFDRNWDLIRQERRGQVHCVLPLGTVADIHWHVLNRGRVRGGFALNMGDLFDRSRQVQLDGLSVRTLDEPDTLVHLCLHAALSGGHRLLWLKDVERVIVTDRPSWGTVITRARSWQAAVPVGMVLDRARRVLDAPVPDAAIAALLPPMRCRITRTLDTRWPPELTKTRPTPATIWVQCARETWRATGLAVAWRLTQRPRRLLRAHRYPTGSAHAEILIPAGGREQRTRFLEEVSGGER